MATVSERQSLEDIKYKSPIRLWMYPLITGILFTIAFLNHFPVGAELKNLIKKNLRGSVCNPDWDQLRLEFFMPKIVITDLSLPAGCFNRMGDPIKLSFININFHLISFAPFGIPFKIETEVSGQPLTVYFVQGFGSKTIRIIDQQIVLARINSLLSSSLKLSGSVTVDVNATLGSGNALTDFGFKAQSKDFQLPPQSIEGFTTPNMRVNDFYLEAVSQNSSRITVKKFILGDPESPMRANFRGKVDLQAGAAAFSPLDLTGEIAFSDNLKQTLPLVDLLFQSYTQKDGFYQIRIGGTLGQPKLSHP